MNLKQKAKNLQPILRIGKSGITDNVLAEISKLLKKKKLIKIKILNNCSEEEVISKIISKTNSELISNIGNTFSIYRDI